MERAAAAPTNRSRGGSGSGCSARKAAKRAIFPWINSQIIAVADSGDLALLMSTIETYAPEMNLVNLATALHRLARLTAADPNTPVLQVRPQKPLLETMAKYALSALERAQAGKSTMHTQAMSNIAWSFATLQFVDLPLLKVLADTAHERAQSFKPFELTMILWAFAKLGTIDPTAWECSAALFKVASVEVLRRPQDFPFRCLVMTVWAFATAGWRQPELFRGVAPRLARLAQSGSCRELASAVWALGTAGVREEELYSELARKASQQLVGQEKEDLAEVLGTLLVGGPLEPCTERASKAAPRARKADMTGRSAGRGAAAGTAEPRRTGPREAGGDAAEDFRRQPPPSAAEPVLRSAGPVHRARRCGRAATDVGLATRAESRSKEEEEAAGPVSPSAEQEQQRGSAAEALGAPFSGWANGVVIKNGFLHVEETKEDEEDYSGKPPLRPLGPSLGIIPPDICPAKLEAYRMDYQRFRAGRAAGARGELTQTTARRGEEGF